MGTAGGEPRVLLNALKPMLGVVGDIKTPQEVMRVVGMMKDAEKLMSRCVYLNILKATCRQAMQNEEKKETLQKFLTTGGWGILNKWLFEFTKSENFPVLLELIEVLKVLPITVDLLKQGNTGKLIKQMTKLEHSDVKKNSLGLIRKWKNMIMKKKPPNEAEGKGDESQDGKRTREEEKGAANEKRSKKIGDPKQTSDTDTGETDEKMKRKISDLYAKQVSDSSGFMNALNAAASAPIKKRRRTSTDSTIKKATLPLDEILKNSTDEKKVKLEADGERLEPAGSPEADEDENSFLFHSPAVEAANLAMAAESGNDVIIDEGSLARKKHKKRRNITWAPEDQLVKISYFELLEGEKKGHHAENFSQALQLELMLEKQAIRAVRRGEDKMSEKMQWCRLIPVDNAGVPNFMPGEKSREKFIQAEREKTVLAYIFLTKKSLPDNPTEPDFDPDGHSNRSHQPRMIPHDEDRTILPPPKSKSSHQPSSSNQNTSAHSNSSSSTLPVKPKQNQSGHPDLVSPVVQNIMTHLLRNNMPNDQQQQQQQQQVQQLPPPMPIINPPIPPPNVPNMVPSILGPPVLIPPPIMPFPNGPLPNMNQQAPNNMNNFMPPMEPMQLMDNSATNPRGRLNRGGGPRFQGGRGFINGRGGGEAGFNPPPPVAPGPRPRWDGPPNQGPKRNGSWNQQNDGNYDTFHEENYHENYNENYNEHYNENYNDKGNYGGQGRNDGFGSGNGGRDRGFRRGGSKGRGNNDRGRGNNDRGRYSGNNEWGYEGNRGNDGPRNRRDNNADWNREDRNYGHISNRGRDRNGASEGQRNREDRSKACCQHFQTPRGCRHGDRCKFTHARH